MLFMNLTGGLSRCFYGRQRTRRGKKMYIRRAILAAASALAMACPAAASDLPVAAYSGGPTYERETHTYESTRTGPPVVVAEPGPVTTDTVIVRRPVVVPPPRVVVEEYPVYS